MNPVNIAGASIGLVLALVYVGVAFCINGNKPEVARIIVTILSGVGFATGLSLCYIAFAYSEVELGKLSDHTISIIIGGVAICYVSTDAVVGCFQKPVSRDRPDAAA